MYYYYKQGILPPMPAIENGVEIVKCTPHPIIPNMSPMQMGRKRFLYFKIMTFLCRGFHGVFKEYDVIVGDIIVSKAVLISKVPIYRFFPKNGIHLCYCETIPESRGKGYYSLLLSYIQNDLQGTNLYMMVEDSNFASIRGIEKAGFIRYANGIKKDNGVFVVEKYLD